MSMCEPRTVRVGVSNARATPMIAVHVNTTTSIVDSYMLRISLPCPIGSPTYQICLRWEEIPSARVTSRLYFPPYL